MPHPWAMKRDPRIGVGHIAEKAAPNIHQLPLYPYNMYVLMQLVKACVKYSKRLKKLVMNENKLCCCGER